MGNVLKVTALLILFASALGACSKDSDSPTRSIIGQGGQTAASASSGALSDGQILQILSTADSGEITQAHLAVMKAADTRVRGFAQTMIDQHTQAELDGQQVALQNAITLAQSTDSQSLQHDIDTTQKQLQAASGTSYDQMYMQAQVKQHQAVLTLVTDKLLSAAVNPAVRDLLGKARDMVQSHLAQARQLTM